MAASTQSKPKTPKPPPGIALRNIPGLADLLDSTREVELATREDAWVGISHQIAGQRVRIMTVRDYTALLQFNNPVLHRALPSPSELSFFLWVLSPEIEKWHEREGWRGYWFLKWMEARKSQRHGKRLRTILQLEELERAEEEWTAKSKLPFTVPDNSPFLQSVQESFKYLDLMFLDRPAALKKNGAQSGMCYLTSWFDILQSEYHLPTEEIWRMKLPILFARIKAIQARHNRNLPEFNEQRDKIFQNLMLGLRNKWYTYADLCAGRVDFHTNRLRNN